MVTSINIRTLKHANQRGGRRGGGVGGGQLTAHSILRLTLLRGVVFTVRITVHEEKKRRGRGGDLLPQLVSLGRKKREEEAESRRKIDWCLLFKAASYATVKPSGPTCTGTISLSLSLLPFSQRGSSFPSLTSSPRGPSSTPVSL